LFASDMDEMYELLAADMEDEEQAADYLLTDIDSLLN